MQPWTSLKHPSKYLTDLVFANDITILVDSVENVKHLSIDFQKATAFVGFHLNESKTENLSNSISTASEIKTKLRRQMTINILVLGS